MLSQKVLFYIGATQFNLIKKYSYLFNKFTISFLSPVALDKNFIKFWCIDIVSNKGCLFSYFQQIQLTQLASRHTVKNSKSIMIQTAFLLDQEELSSYCCNSFLLTKKIQNSERKHKLSIKDGLGQHSYC